MRTNLGISFVPVEQRRVEKTLRVPGHFELQPSARREYRTPVPGRVELLVDQFDRVKVDTLLYRIDSPGWRDLQQQLVEVEVEGDQFRAQADTYGPLLAAHEEHESSLIAAIELWSDRILSLIHI